MGHPHALGAGGPGNGATEVSTGGGVRLAATTAETFIVLEGLGPTASGALQCTLPVCAITGKSYLSSLDGRPTSYVNASASSVVRFEGEVGGAGELVLIGDGTVVLASDDNWLTGGVRFDSEHGTLVTAGVNAIPGQVTLNVGGPGNTLVVESALFVKGLAGEGRLDIRAPNGRVEFFNTLEDTFYGIVSGDGGLTRYGTRRQSFSRMSTLTGSFTIQEGIATLMPDAALPGPITVAGSGQLELFQGARVGSLTIPGGTVVARLGAVGSVGGLSMNGDATLALETSLTGSLGALSVTGPVALHSARLSLRVPFGFTAALNDVIPLVLNDGGDAVTGRFDQLPEDATVTIGRVRCHIDYAGGDGNDVPLKVTKVFREYLLSKAPRATSSRPTSRSPIPPTILSRPRSAFSPPSAAR
jgi:hypothetical protein